MRSHCDITEKSLGNRCEIAAISPWECFAIATKTLRDRCAIAARSLLNRFVSTVQLLQNRAQALLNHC
jgi:hypothetical protein